ncbi:MFS transporter [Arenicella chitinivorans]|uniref:MFS transporter n=1 Tax=Arenicella chitinivorans TaxID=1329800 RepID=A0A918VQW8_9GAMM|nr:organoarsenical effux MFS transporter ArsJ [Arenicella chitinivorans]GHA17521.1 MFS transporter [Arenicella chitinivorans]
MSRELRQYLIITGNYWGFTLTDGALRMLVVLYFHTLGYSALDIAFLFLFYEFFGVVTNLVGGWLGARIGLNRTMNLGLFLQILALAALLVPNSFLTIAWVMAAQALSGIAKDLNKMSAKSAIKSLVPADHNSRLYRLVAVLTGSKNALKGIGFFIGGLMLSLLGFHTAILCMVGFLALIWIFSLITLRAPLQRAEYKPKFSEMWSKSRAINTLSAARLFLFGARDVWFVVALPVYFSSQLDWTHASVGAFFAAWVIGYGVIQASAPLVTGQNPSQTATTGWCVILTVVMGLITAISWVYRPTAPVLVIGLLVFGAVFAINSALHSFNIVHLADHKRVSMDVGFYYMSNAAGRLLGTVASGWLYTQFSLLACLLVSTLFLLSSSIIVSRVSTR